MSNSYCHIHVYFDPEIKHFAEAIHKYFVAFKGSVHYPSLTVGKIHDNPVGPHTKGQFQMEMNLDEFGHVIHYLMTNRNHLSVLIHPQTGHDVEDHTSNCFWMGDKLPLVLAKL
jgi:DOPA 4,5-dioxygenase